MLTQLVQFELKYQLRQRAFVLFLLLFGAIGFLAGRQGYSRAKGIYNSSQSISEITGIISLGSGFIIMFFVISAVLRDKQYGMQSLIFSTKLSKFNFVFSRFFGVLVMSVLAFSGFLLGFAITTVLPHLDTQFVHPFYLHHYLWTLLIIVIPNVFICASIIFSVSLLSQNQVATYASAILIYVLYFVCSLYLNSPVMAQSVPNSEDSLLWASLLDPFGLSAMFEQTLSWTLVQKQTQSIAFSGYFMWNRLLWMAVSAVLLMLSYLLFSFKKMREGTKKVPKTIKDSKPSIVLQYQPEVISITAISQLKAVASLLNIELKAVFKSLPFVAMLLLWLVIVILSIASRIYEGGQYNDSLYPETNLLIELFQMPLWALGLVLIIFFSGEVVWRERMQNFFGIIDATPTSNLAFFSSKLIAVMLLPFVLIVVAVIVCVAFQLFGNYRNYDWSRYALMLYYPGFTFIIYTVLAVFIQSVSPNKYVGMAISALFIICFGTSASSYLGIAHPLLRVGYLPDLSYSGMNGFANTKPYNHLALLWLSFAGILAFMAFKIRQRGLVRSLKQACDTAFKSLTIQQKGLLAGLVMAFIGFASLVFYNTNVLNAYWTKNESLSFQENYEKTYKKYDTEDAIFPIRFFTKVDLFPTKNAFKVNAEYTLQNKGQTTITEVFITEKEPLESIQIEGAKLTQHDSVYGTYLFQLAKPLQPKDSLKMIYNIDRQYKGYEQNKGLIENGSYLTERSFSPVFGYSNGYEIKNPLEREKRGLPKLVVEDIDDHHIATAESKIGRIQYETIVSTNANQTVLASGELLKQWTANNRNYYHYKAKELVIPTVAYFSADYKVTTSKHRNLDLAYYYQEGHDFNLSDIDNSTKHTIDYCLDNFGPYPFKHLRIAEVPKHWPFGGFAHPGTISMVENRLYFTDLRNSDAFNLVAKRTIHEVAHQWFGHILAPKPTEGSSILVEGFAKYIEAMVMEKHYGPSAVWELSQNANSKYFNWRSIDNALEPPLYKVSGQGYLSYGKSQTAFLALRDLVGEQTINTAIRNVIDSQKNNIELTATTIDFLEELYALTDTDKHELINDWFKRIVTYDLSIKNAEVKQIDSGRYQANISIKAKKFLQNETTGNSTEIAINEPIKIGAFKAHPSKLTDSDILSLKTYTINAESMTIQLELNEHPSFIVIDPFGTRSDANFYDNVFRVE